LSAPHGPDAEDATRPDPRGDPCAQMTEAVCPPSSGPGSRPVSLGGDRLLTTGVHLEPSRQAARLEDRSDIALEAAEPQGTARRPRPPHSSDDRTDPSTVDGGHADQVD